jgi:hypothetical protein
MFLRGDLEYDPRYMQGTHKRCKICANGGMKSVTFRQAVNRPLAYLAAYINLI